jgi:glycosyltransferase involved in cell wall biosynthesis
MATSGAGQGNIAISIVVCTFNRSTLLKSCLRSLVEQTADMNSFEVLVIDNNSTDNTQEVVATYVNNNPQFRLHFEPSQGLSHARNRGWKEAHGQYVAYIDDDAIAYPDWISNIAGYIARHPDAGIFGGPYDPYFLSPKPDWFPPEYGSLFLGDEERCIKLGNEWVTGSNMVINKELFFRYGGFNTMLGMNGSKAAYGEEINLFLCMHEKGIPIYYVPSIKVSHLVAEYKMSLRWLLLAGYSVGRNYEVIFKINRTLLCHVKSLIIAVFVAVYKLLRPVSMPFKRRLFYSLYQLYCEVGAAVEYFSCLFRKEVR